MQAKKHKKIKRIGPGRPKLYGRRILLPLTETTYPAIDQALRKGETRLDFIRMAIAAELKRRER
jgi:hypothetical protein